MPVMEPVAKTSVSKQMVVTKPMVAAHQPLPKQQANPKARGRQLRLVATPVKAAELIAEAAEVLQKRPNSSGHSSAPTPLPKHDEAEQGLDSSASTMRSRSQGAQAPPMLARIEGVVTQMQQELDEVKAFSDHCWAEGKSFEGPPLVRPPQEPITDATLLHPGQSPVANGVALQVPVKAPPMLSPTLVYTVRHPPLATPNWQWELQNRKWRANAEHIVKLESEWAQRVKDAEEVASRSDERARLAEEAHGRLLLAKADLAEAAKTREARLEEELKKAKAEQQAATEARDAGVKRQQQERKSLEDDYDMERKGLREEIKVLEDERSEILAGRDLLQEELSTASTSLEAQQKHAVELKKELAKLHSELDLLREEQSSYHERVEELTAALAQAHDTIEAQQNHMAELKSSMTTLPSSELNNSCTDLDESGEAMHVAVENLRHELAAERASSEDQRRLSVHLKQKLLTLEEELAQSQRSSDDQAGRESALKKQLAQKEAALAKARQKTQTFESLNKDLDQAVADLQLDLAGTKSREETHQSRLLALKQELAEKDNSLRELKRKVEGAQERKSKAEAEAKQMRDAMKSLEGAETARLVQLEAQLLASQANCEAVQGEKVDLEEEVRILQQECGKISDLSAEKDGMEASFRDQIARLQDELAEVKLAHNSDQLAIAALQQQVVVLEREVGRRQEDLECHEASEAELQTLSTDLETQLKTVKERSLEMSTEHAALQQALERQSDIEVELHSKVGTLKVLLEEAEAQSALHYEAMEQAFEEKGKQLAEDLLLQSELQEAGAQLAMATTNQNMQQELIARLQTSLSASTAEMSQSRSDFAAQEAVKARISEESQLLQSEAQKNVKLIQSLRAQLSKSEDELTVANTAFQTLQTVEAELRGQLQKQESSISESSGQLKVQESLATHLEQRLKETMSELSAVRSECSSQEHRLRQVTEELSASEVKLSEAEASVEERMVKELDYLQQLEMLDASLAAQLADNELQLTAKTQLEQGSERLKSELLASEQAIDQRQKGQRQLEEELARLATELEKLQASCEAKDKASLELQELLSTVDAELTGARSGAKAQQKLAEELKLRLETKENEQKEQEQQQEQLVLVLERECEDAKSKVLHLNTELLNSERAVEAERQRSLGLERRLGSIEDQLASAQKDGESLQGREADLKTNLAQKEFLLLDAQATSEARRANEAALRNALQTQEKLLADERVAKDVAERQLLQSNASVNELQRELAEMEREMQKSRDEHSSSHQHLHSQLRSSEALAKMESLHVESLRERLQEMSSQLSSKKKLSDENQELAPENDFQQKAKQLRKRVAAALRRAADAQHAILDLEIAQLCKADGAEVQTQRLSSRRWRIAQELETLLEQVKSTLLLRDDTGSDADELYVEQLELDIQLIAQELVLLRSPPLDDVPQSVVKALASFSGILLHGGDQEQYPMHWAADHGRRDIMEFFLRYPSGEDLLLQRDQAGRIPLFYAERRGNDALAMYLREHGADINPQEPTQQRPSSANIPAAYEDVIKVVEERGWHAVNWIEGFTLLHWAAEKGLADFCRYFVSLNADPNATDSRGRTPLQCATDSNHRDAERTLRELMGLEPEESEESKVKEHLRPRSNSDCPQPPHWPMESRRASCMDSLRQNLSQGSGTSEIPDAYLRVMKQIDQIGWEKMCWKRGFTLLHWAAKHDRGDLCELFLWHGADAEHRDESNRSAVDYARLRQPPALAALEALQRGKPLQRPILQLQG